MKKAFFVLSVVLHVMFIYWFTTLKFSHGPIIKEINTKDIIIVTPVKLFTPTPENMPAKKASFTGKKAFQLITKSAGQTVEQPGIKKSEHPDRETPGKKEANPERTIVKIFESDPDDTGPGTWTASKPGDTDPAAAPRFSLNPDTMMRIIGTGGSRKGIFTASPGGSSFFQVQGCNILPWARRVLRKVKQNWTIPAAAESGAKGLVGVSITVERDGSMSSITITQSSQDDSLDKSALTAFTVSNPLPHLPDDFPYRDLHAYFLFNYNDREITSPIKKE